MRCVLLLALAALLLASPASFALRVTPPTPSDALAPNAAPAASASAAPQAPAAAAADDAPSNSLPAASSSEPQLEPRQEQQSHADSEDDDGAILAVASAPQCTATVQLNRFYSTGLAAVFTTAIKFNPGLTRYIFTATSYPTAVSPAGVNGVFQTLGATTTVAPGGANLPIPGNYQWQIAVNYVVGTPAYSSPAPNSANLNLMLTGANIKTATGNFNQFNYRSPSALPVEITGTWTRRAAPLSGTFKVTLSSCRIM